MKNLKCKGCCNSSIPAFGECCASVDSCIKIKERQGKI